MDWLKDTFCSPYRKKIDELKNLVQRDKILKRKQHEEIMRLEKLVAEKDREIIMLNKQVMLFTEKEIP